MRLNHKIYQTIPSTQDEIKKFSHEITEGSILLCTAEEQTKGRGTKNRSWLSLAGVNIYASYGFIVPSYRINDLSIISLVAGYAVFLTLEFLKFNNSSIKWVNDVLLDNKKIAGILCESIKAPKEDGYIVYLGLGFNVNMDKALCDSLDQPVTSLKASTGSYHNKNEILACLNTHLVENLSRFISNGFQNFYMKISNAMAFKNERIFFDTENDSCIPRAFYAKALGINPRGALILQPELDMIQINQIRNSISPSHSTVDAELLHFITGRILRESY